MSELVLSNGLKLQVNDQSVLDPNGMTFNTVSVQLIDNAGAVADAATFKVLSSVSPQACPPGMKCVPQDAIVLTQDQLVSVGPGYCYLEQGQTVTNVQQNGGGGNGPGDDLGKAISRLIADMPLAVRPADAEIAAVYDDMLAKLAQVAAACLAAGLNLPDVLAGNAQLALTDCKAVYDAWQAFMATADYANMSDVSAPQPVKDLLVLAASIVDDAKVYWNAIQALQDPPGVQLV